MHSDPMGEMFWDVFDCFMAAISWDDFFNNPSLVNFGWAALDTLSILPVVPSTSYIRRGADTISAAKQADRVIDAYSSWQEAEKALRRTMNSVISVSERTISTAKGIRICDSLNTSTKLVGEAKYGYQALSNFIKREIEKDKCLKRMGYNVEWHFYISQVTGKGGPSAPLRKALESADIKIIEHF